MGLLEEISRRMQPGWNPGMAESPAPDEASTNPLMMLAQRAGLLAAPPAPIAPVVMPAPRPAGAPAPVATDISAAARLPVPDISEPSPSPSSDSSSMFGRLGGGLMDGLSKNSNALLAIGAGFAGAPNIGQAISRASAAVIPAHAADVKQQLTQQSQTYGTKALIDAGVPAQQAIAAAGDPELKKALIQNYIVDRKAELKQIGVDQYGQPRFGVFDPFSKKIEPVKTGFEGADNASTVDALVEAGVPKNLALAAQRSPDIMKSVTANYLNDRKGELKEIGVDRYGNKIWGIFDPFTKKISPVSSSMDDAASPLPRNAISTPPSPVAGTSGTTDISSRQQIKVIGKDRYGEDIRGIFDPDTGKVTPLPSNPLGRTVNSDTDNTGPAFLEILKEDDPAYARQVEAVINGDAPFPTGKQAQTPLGRKIIQDVLTVEPGSSVSDFATRQGVRKDYASGNAAKVTKAVNTAITHGAGLEKAISDLHNFSFAPGILNTATGAIKKQYDTKYQAARKEFETNAENYVRELDFAISGGRPTVSGAAHQRSAFDINASPEENMASLRKSIELLKGRLDSHAEGFNKGMRTNREGMDFVDPTNKRVFQHLLGETAPAPAAATPAIPPPLLSVGKSTVINGVTIKRLD